MTPAPAHPDKLAELHARLADEVTALRAGADWQRWLATAARFHEYSFQNTLLILSQQPTATNVAGYETWKALGRQVNRGEKGIAILAPILRRRPDAPTEPQPDDVTDTPGILAGFRVTDVWDISQTTGPPLPGPPTPRLLQGQAPDGLWDTLTGLVTGAGFTLDRGPAGGANGITDFGTRAVRIRDDLDDAQAVKTLAHELGHVHLHVPDPAHPLTGTMACRGLIEVEAESVAYLIAASHGLDTGSYTFPYVAGWASDVPGHRPEDVVRITGDRVLTAARHILSRTQLAASPTPGARQNRAQVRPVADARREPAPPVPQAAREQLLAVYAEAAAFFRRHLDRSWVPPYLHGRGLDAALDPPWDAGRAPAGWTTLVTHLRRQGIDDQTLLASGLAIRARTGRLIDVFRERLVLPIRDDDGHVIGFIGRAHPDASLQTPKYLNSPTTDLYAKGKHLFGIHQNLPDLQRGALPVLVEGPLDAVAVTAVLGGRAAGIATCGSTLTGAHLDHLDARAIPYRGGVAVAFDADPAGHQATNHAAALLSHRATPAAGIDWSPSKDPASVLRQHGPAELATRLLDHATPLNDLVVDRRLARWEKQLHTPEGRLGAARAVALLLADFGGNATERQVARASQRIGIDADVITSEIGRAPTGLHDATRPGPAPTATPPARRAGLSPWTASRRPSR
jgi:DNA primase